MTNYENYFKVLDYLEVQEDGSVWRKERTYVAGNGTVRFQPRQLAKTCLEKSGYVQTSVWIDGKQYHLKVHVLVALVHIPKPYGWDETWEVNHKNGVKTDCRKENLEWVTRSENMRHAYRTGLSIRSENAGTPKRPVEQIELVSGKVIKTFVSLHDAAKQFDGKHNNISSCCSGKRKTAYGYGWRYANPTSLSHS